MTLMEILNYIYDNHPQIEVNVENTQVELRNCFDVFQRFVAIVPDEHLSKETLAVLSKSLESHGEFNIRYRRTLLKAAIDELVEKYVSAIKSETYSESEHDYLIGDIEHGRRMLSMMDKCFVDGELVIPDSARHREVLREEIAPQETAL